MGEISKLVDRQSVQIDHTHRAGFRFLLEDGLTFENEIVFISPYYASHEDFSPEELSLELQGRSPIPSAHSLYCSSVLTRVTW